MREPLYLQGNVPAPTVNWVLTTGSEGNMDAANEVCPLVRALVVRVTTSPSPLGAASATLVLQAWWWPGTCETSYAGCVSHYNCIAGGNADVHFTLLLFTPVFPSVHGIL